MRQHREDSKARLQHREGSKARLQHREDSKARLQHHGKGGAETRVTRVDEEQ
jgi:hypothetical protein